MEMNAEGLNRAIAAELRAESARLGFIQRDAAKAIGISQSTMSPKWNGHVPLTVAELVAWCELLDVSVATIVDRAKASVLTQLDVARAAENRDGTDEGDYDSA
jgi:transcriptional regulator with XRE-family HTH domain